MEGLGLIANNTFRFEKGMKDSENLAAHLHQKLEQKTKRSQLKKNRRDLVVMENSNFHRVLYNYVTVNGVLPQQVNSSTLNVTVLNSNKFVSS